MVFKEGFVEKVIFKKRLDGDVGITCVYLKSFLGRGNG